MIHQSFDITKRLIYFCATFLYLINFHEDFNSDFQYLKKNQFIIKFSRFNSFMNFKNSEF